MVKPDGTLEGTPGRDEVGVNVFHVRVENGSGSSDSMTLVVDVQPSE